MAKNTKGGLGRGLDSLLGGYEAAMQPARPAASSSEVEREKTPAAPTPAVDSVERRIAPARTAEREVIREEDLPQEERAVLDGEKKESSSIKSATESVKPTIAVKDVIAKKELIEDNDGVTIVGVVERVPQTSAQQSVSPHGGISQNPTTVSSAASVRPANAIEANAAKEKLAADALEGNNIAVEVDIERVKPNPDQPRMHFNKDELEELSSSIQKDGLLQPIVVRKVEDDYEIIAGERRWQACKLAKMEKVPVRVIEADDMKVLELALIENLQRSDLNPIEEAYGYKRMMERGGRTQSEVAAAVSKGRSTIANALRLLDLPEEAQQLLYEERITAGHARAILSIPTEEGRQKLTDKLKKEKLSVREAESIARLFAGRAKAASQPPRPLMPNIYKTTAKSLTEEWGTKVRIRSANGKNKIEIEFKDEEDLQRLLEKMHEGHEEA